MNELPLSMVLSWYEQKAVCILLTLLHLGIQNIKLGPTPVSYTHLKRGQRMDIELVALLCPQ